MKRLKTQKYVYIRPFLLVTPAGFEPAIFWMRTRRPGPLDDGAKQVYFTIRRGSLGFTWPSGYLCLLEPLNLTFGAA